VSAPQPAPVIVVGCHKGGIGRTAVAVNLAAMLALSGRQTLLVDLDSKGDATASVGLPRAERGKSLARFSEPWSFLKDTFNAPRPSGLDVWPGGPALDVVANQLTGSANWRHLARGLEQARLRYRAIVIDAPSDLGPLAKNAFAAGDALLLPVSSSAHAEEAVEATVRAAREFHEPYDVFGVTVETRLVNEEPTEAEAPKGVQLLDCAICFDAETFLHATQAGLPVFEAAPESRAARSFLELGREVLARIVP
jgi:chromosome partitioning protein